MKETKSSIIISKNKTSIATKPLKKKNSAKSLVIKSGPVIGEGFFNALNAEPTKFNMEVGKLYRFMYFTWDVYNSLHILIAYYDKYTIRAL